jgi:hypothetical protein
MAFGQTRMAASTLGRLPQATVKEGLRPIKEASSCIMLLCERRGRVGQQDANLLESQPILITI